jgi:hypothetical protein
MVTILARFADGRLLVQQSTVCTKAYDYTLKSGSNFTALGAAIRVQNVKTIDKVISVDNIISGYNENLITNLNEVSVSGDIIYVKMRRGDVGLAASGYTYALASGGAGIGGTAGITSGRGFMSELISGNVAISGVVTVIASVIAY